MVKNPPQTDTHEKQAADINVEKIVLPAQQETFLVIIVTFVFVVCVMCVATSVKFLSRPDCNA